MKKELMLMVEKLPPAERDELYRYLWASYIKDDVRMFLESIKYSEPDFDDIVDVIAEKIVYDGDYDSNLSHWNNIENLFNQEKGEMLNGK